MYVSVSVRSALHVLTHLILTIIQAVDTIIMPYLT